MEENGEGLWVNMRVLNLVADCDITRSQIQFVIEFTVEETCCFSYEALYRLFAKYAQKTSCTISTILTKVCSNKFCCSNS